MCFITYKCIESIINYRFKNKDLLCKALQIPVPYQADIEENNRLAIIGDKALDMALSISWYLDTTLETKIWDGLRQTYHTNGNLARIAQAKGLCACNLDTAVQATYLEAIVGAAMLDGGLPAVRRVMAGLGLMTDVPNDLDAIRAHWELHNRT